MNWKISVIFLSAILLSACKQTKNNMDVEPVNIIFLHHSTGGGVWKGASNKYIAKITGKGDVEKLIDAHNKQNGSSYFISEQYFPKSQPYGWNNYPYDYYNIWVKNAGNEPYLEEPTLEILTKQYDVIIFKHCFPVSSIQPDSDSADINSPLKTVANYKLQYLALKEKLLSFPETKFIVWTGAALTKESTLEAEAIRAKEFFDWVKKEWDQPEDNIYVWDFHALETEGGLYLKDEYAVSNTDSHPNKEFNGKSARLFVQRITDVIENNGRTSKLTGEKL